MGMKARLAVGATVGLAIIGTVSATAGSDGGNGGPGGGAKATAPASAEHKPGSPGSPSSPGKDSAGSRSSHGSGGSNGSGGAEASEAGGAGEGKKTAPAAKGAPAASMDGDGGLFKVGTDIAPGTYKSTGNADGSCSWERLKGAEGGTDSVLAHGNVTGTAVVTISASDRYFKTEDCRDWKRA
ncbi:hypothetical protein [Streptomyces sp. SudanB182_2057]|uniref:hypothetical protein n=1 Tax=Streptomyces sp. SudanB182_2057 TaxID=3035281 RepID=UPI003F554E44